MRYLALDVGDKRIGLAATDELGQGVWPQKTLLRRDLSSDLQEILGIIRDRKIEGLIFGLPFNMDGTEGPQAKKVRAFAAALQRALEKESLKIPVEWCDERLTSWEAEGRLVERGLKGQKRKANVDAMAACLILEDYLARRRP